MAPLRTRRSTSAQSVVRSPPERTRHPGPPSTRTAKAGPDAGTRASRWRSGAVPYTGAARGPPSSRAGPTTCRIVDLETTCMRKDRRKVPHSQQPTAGSAPPSRVAGQFRPERQEQPTWVRTNDRRGVERCVHHERHGTPRSLHRRVGDRRACTCRQPCNRTALLHGGTEASRSAKRESLAATATAL